MSFGVDNPNGFVPLSIQDVQGTPNVPFDESYSIMSGYNQNIGCGDLVILNTGAPNTSVGYLNNFFDYLQDVVAGRPLVYGTAGPALGVFVGASYEKTYERGDTPYIPAWRNSWVAGTTTQGGAPAKARIIPLTYGYRWSAQMDIQGATQDALGRFVVVVYQQDSNDKVLLGKDGSSTMYLSTFFSGKGTTLVGNPFSPAFTAGVAPVQGTNFTLCQIVGFDNRNGESQVGIPYGQVQVRLCDAQLPMITSITAQ